MVSPLFFRQKRVGKNLKAFEILKFRSMYNSHDKNLKLTIGDQDPRITSIGAFIRKYKLDELPQLINVLKGEMSLVGPRPEVEEYVVHFSESQKSIFKVRPGITGLGLNKV